MKAFTLKVKGGRSIGLISLGSILGVPFVVEIVVMVTIVLTDAYRGVHFIVIDDIFLIWLRTAEEAVWPLLFITLEVFAKELRLKYMMIG